MNNIKENDYNEQIISFYNINLKDLIAISKKAYYLKTDKGPFFLKNTISTTGEKYTYLYEQGVTNIYYPEKNRNNEFVSKSKLNYYYISQYLEHSNNITPIKVISMYKELRSIHQMTSFKRQLDPTSSRPKFEEITRQLDYKFNLIENFIKSIESKPLNAFSMPILENYQYVLDAKKELVRLQKLIIDAVKSHLSVDYSFIHNNPKLDHLMQTNGIKYLTSIENSKIGISSLDMAKLYIETIDLKVDFKALIVDYYYSQNDNFQYDYFRFLILYIYVKRLTINSLDYVSAQNFINFGLTIKKYFEIFLDKQEQITNEDDSDN